MTQSPTTREGASAQQAAPGGDEYLFRAPRHGQLVICPYCDADTFNCDHCGGERRLFADEVFQ